MSDNDLLTFKFEKNFRRGIQAARKKAGRKVGAAFVKRRRSLMGRADARRKKAVIYRVAKNGTLIVYDMAPMAHAQEFGATITPTASSQLFVRISELKAGEMPVRRGDYLLAVKRGTQETRLLGVYKEQVTIDRVSPNRQFFNQVLDFAQDYEDALLKAIDAQEILL